MRHVINSAVHVHISCYCAVPTPLCTQNGAYGSSAVQCVTAAALSPALTEVAPCPAAAASAALLLVPASAACG
jgi:hypothetical protein